VLGDRQTAVSGCKVKAKPLGDEKGEAHNYERGKKEKKISTGEGMTKRA